MEGIVDSLYKDFVYVVFTDIFNFLQLGYLIVDTHGIVQEV